MTSTGDSVSVSGLALSSFEDVRWSGWWCKSLYGNEIWFGTGRAYWTGDRDLEYRAHGALRGARSMEEP